MLAAIGPGGTGAAVLHGGVIGELCRQVTRSRPFAFIHADNCSVTRIVQFSVGHRLLRSFNDTAHLAWRASAATAVRRPVHGGLYGGGLGRSTEWSRHARGQAPHARATPHPPPPQPQWALEQRGLLGLVGAVELEPDLRGAERDLGARRSGASRPARNGAAGAAGEAEAAEALDLDAVDVERGLPVAREHLARLGGHGDAATPPQAASKRVAVLGAQHQVDVADLDVEPERVEQRAAAEQERHAGRGQPQRDRLERRLQRRAHLQQRAERLDEALVLGLRADRDAQRARRGRAPPPARTSTPRWESSLTISGSFSPTSNQTKFACDSATLEPERLELDDERGPLGEVALDAAGRPRPGA